MRHSILRLSLLLLVGLVSCQPRPEPTPRVSIPAALPTAAEVALLATETATPTSTATPTQTSTPRPPTITPTPSNTPTLTPFWTPTPFPAGAPVDPLSLNPVIVREPPPGEFEFVPLTDELEIEYRPPVLPVPVSIHPKDHYWLARPIPSGYRSYDLEYYPFANDVLIDELGPYRIHHGLDFPNEPGTPVLAAGDGTVVFAGVRPSPRNGIDYYGNTIIIEHDWEWNGQAVFTLYAHTLEMFVQEGDRVQTGQLLAGVGGSGQVSGPHLHFEVRVGENNYFSVQNPIFWLAPYEGYGTLAGRFVDSLGRPITGATVTIAPLTEGGRARRVKTYQDDRLPPDDIWQENFALGDLPAGIYEVRVTMTTAEDNLFREYIDTIEVLPGRTNFLLVETDFVFVPTPTPEVTLTPELTGTLGISGTIGVSGTVGITNTLGLTDTLGLETPMLTPAP